MNQKSSDIDLANSLAMAITGPIKPIKSILKGVEKQVNCEDVRFRLRDWQDKSVVYVPDWMIGQTGLEKADPELAKRVYFDPNDVSRMDCVTGYVARIARYKEENSKKNKNIDLLNKLGEGLEASEIKEQKICFNNLSDESVFKKFIERLEKEGQRWAIKSSRWKNYLDFLRENIDIDNESFKNEAFGPKAPWKKEKPHSQTEKQWIQLYDSLNPNDGANTKFLEYVERTSDRYEDLTKEWDNYHKHAKDAKCEIAIPVVAFNNFLGVLNFHRDEEFTENDEKTAKFFAARLAIACLQRQTELFDDFQKVTRRVAAKSNFEEIASKIAEGIRIGLQDGLQPNEVYPLLYVATQPISKYDNLSDDQFKDRWENTYRKRQEPKKRTKDHSVWERENVLGPIPIRSKGLGRDVIEKWKKQKDEHDKKNSYLFVDVTDVDDPNSMKGSRTALKSQIKSTGCLPLIFEDQVYGLLYLHCLQRHFFTDSEVRSLRTSALQAAIAINNTRKIGQSYEELFGIKILDLLSGGK